jgi:hypothetical protein
LIGQFGFPLSRPLSLAAGYLRPLPFGIEENLLSLKAGAPPPEILDASSLVHPLRRNRRKLPFEPRKGVEWSTGLNFGPARSKGRQICGQLDLHETVWVTLARPSPTGSSSTSAGGLDAE